MEGPTPVSALIHAATMVTAGVFLIIRCSYMFEFSHVSLTILVYLGSLSIFLFGLVALAQFDIKKIIAYSTCSQLGYMILACGLSGYHQALFHLFTHASFKALLFLAAGSIIHLMKNEQDIRRLTCIFNKTPLVSICFIIGLMSLIGFPHFSGYYSKDAIICLSRTYEENLVIFLSTIFGLILTVLYSLRLFYYLFIKSDFSRRSQTKVTHNYKTSLSNVGPLVILSLMSIFSGYIFKVFFIGLGNDIFHGSILVLDYTRIIFSELLLSHLKHDIIVPTIFITIISSICFMLDRYYNRIYKNKFYYYFFSRDTFMFFNRGFFFDSLVNLFISSLFLEISYVLYYIFDKGLLELFGPKGISNFYNSLY